MMHYCVLLLLVLLLILSVYCVELWSSDFTNDINGWTYNNPDAGYRSAGSWCPYDNKPCLVIEPHGEYTHDTTTTEGYQNITISFAFRGQQVISMYDYCQVFLSIDSGNSYSYIWRYQGAAQSSEQFVTLPLPETTNVIIKLSNTATGEKDFNYCYFDDITLNALEIQTQTTDPTNAPTIDPTAGPSTYPTIYPTTNPTTYPTIYPTTYPTTNPTTYPTLYPTITYPTIFPTTYPTLNPTVNPTVNPTNDPTNILPSTSAIKITENNGQVHEDITTAMVSLKNLKNDTKDDAVLILIVIVTVLILILIPGFALVLCYKKNYKKQNVLKNIAEIYLNNPVQPDTQKQCIISVELDMDTPNGGCNMELVENNKGEGNGIDVNRKVKQWNVTRGRIIHSMPSPEADDVIVGDEDELVDNINTPTQEGL